MEPKLAIQPEMLSKNLKTFISYEGLNINGTKITTNGKDVTELDIEIINGTSKVAGKELASLGENIAMEISKALSNGDEFDTYKIHFVSEKSSGIGSASMTKTYEYVLEKTPLN